MRGCHWAAAAMRVPPKPASPAPSSRARTRGFDESSGAVGLDPAALRLSVSARNTGVRVPSSRRATHLPLGEDVPPTPALEVGAWATLSPSAEARLSRMTYRQCERAGSRRCLLNEWHRFDARMLTDDAFWAWRGAPSNERASVLGVWVSKLPLLCARRMLGDDALLSRCPTPQLAACWGDSNEV
jgi:hypothetical protein